MGDVAILEAAHDMGDGVAFADIGEELIAEPLTLRGAAHEAGNIHECEARRYDFLRARDFGELFDARIGHRDVADIRLDGAERVIGRLRRRGLRQRIEKGRLADVRQADDAAFETHGSGPVGGLESRAARARGGRLAGKIGHDMAIVARRPHVKARTAGRVLAAQSHFRGFVACKMAVARDVRNRAAIGQKSFT